VSSKPQRKKFTEYIKCHLANELATDIDSAIEYLQELKRVFEKSEYTELFLESSSTDIHLIGVRPEDDNEYKHRCAQIKKRKVASEKRKEKKRTKEYVEYIKLKAKFENEN